MAVAPFQRKGMWVNPRKHLSIKIYILAVFGITMTQYHISVIPHSLSLNHRSGKQHYSRHHQPCKQFLHNLVSFMLYMQR